MKSGGRLLAIEIEKSDNIFTRIFFEDIVGLREPPGLSRGDLEKILGDCGFGDIETTSRAV
jgi:hypothetical protein